MKNSLLPINTYTTLIELLRRLLLQFSHLEKMTSLIQRERSKKSAPLIPIYTPTTTNKSHRARRLRRVKLTTSSRTSKTGRSRVFKSVWRSIRKHHQRSSSSSSGSTSSSTGDNSSHSDSSWTGWRFWKNSSSGSSASSKASDSDDEEWEPPTPHFTLLTPCLARTKQPYPPHLLPSATPSWSRTPAFGGNDAATSSDLRSPAVINLSTTSRINPALERLQTFWLERRQTDGISGDLGAGAGAGVALGADQEEPLFFPDLTTAPATSTTVPLTQQSGRKESAAACYLRPGFGRLREPSSHWSWSMSADI